MPGTFDKSGYAVVRGLVAKPVVSFLFEYAMKSARRGDLPSGDDFVAGTPCCYADPLMESLLELLVPKVELVTRLRLFPTYSYFRVYKQGDILKRHQDRPSCEISLTLNLGYFADNAWPIWLEVDGVAQPVILEPGDVLLYRGIELPHWRDLFTGEHSAQVFLHYVNQDGQYKEWKYDKRPGLVKSPIVKNVFEKLGPL